MSDTSTLSAIKIYGQMVEFPKDSSVYWDDVLDKPTTKTQIGVNIYEDRQGQPVNLFYGNTTNELDYAITTTVSKGYFDFYINPGSHYYNSTYTDRNGNTQSLTEEQKKYLAMYCYENGQYRSKIILYLPYDGVSEPTSEDVQKVLIDSEDIEDVSIYLKNYSTGSGKFNVLMYPTFKGSTTINDLYTQTTVNRSWKVSVLDKVYSEVFDSSVIDAYTKTEADNKFLQSNDISTFITSNDVSNFCTTNDISAFITSNDISTFVTDNDVSIYLTDNDISTFITSNDVSNFATDNDISTFITSNDVSNFAKIQYISQTDYDNLSVKDPNTLYIIPA